VAGVTPKRQASEMRTAENTGLGLPLGFQGRYGAALVTNLRNLPAQLTSTLKATFSGEPARIEPPYCADVDKDLVTSSGNEPAPCSATSQHANARRIDSVSAVAAVSEPKSIAFGHEPSFHVAALTNIMSGESFVEFTQTQQDRAPTPQSPAATTGAQGGTTNTQNGDTTGTNCDSSTTTDPTTNVALQKPCSLTQTIRDEGLEHWDVSIAVPTPGFKETVFDSSNALMPKSVTRTNAYAMLDISPWGEDFVKPPLFGIPHFMTGLPIAGKVFNKPFVGGLGEEVGLSKLSPFSARVFGGVVYNKEFRGAAQVPHRVWKVQYGIELSMSSAISKLKGNSSKTNSTTSK
jgi:hypothetical protein